MRKNTSYYLNEVGSSEIRYHKSLIKLLKMTLRWDYAKPSGTSEKLWRRQQIGNFLVVCPGCKPKDVYKWVSSHSPNPWPSCNTNKVSKMLIRMRKSCDNGGLSLCLATLKDTFDELPLRWDIKKPRNVDIHYWRRTQLTRYVNEFPSHKPKKIL